MSYSIMTPCWNCKKNKICTDARKLQEGVNKMYQDGGHLGSGTIVLSCSNAVSNTKRYDDYLWDGSEVIVHVQGEPVGTVTSLKDVPTYKFDDSLPTANANPIKPVITSARKAAASKLMCGSIPEDEAENARGYLTGEDHMIDVHTYKSSASALIEQIDKDNRE